MATNSKVHLAYKIFKFRFDADPSVSLSGVTIVTSNATLFSVEWRDLVVREAKHLGRFTFGVALSILGDITFVYEKVLSLPRALFHRV